MNEIEIVDTTCGELKPMDWVLTGASSEISENDNWKQVFWVTPPRDEDGQVIIMFGNGSGEPAKPPEATLASPDKPCHAVMAENIGQGDNFFTLLSQMPYKGDTVN